ncbi:MAG: hypothetical protein JXA74_13780 [Anaerolineae bacterium]|nr:hypothetical protein [Anaerolineae bacterium]
MASARRMAAGCGLLLLLLTLVGARPAQADGGIRALAQDGQYVFSEQLQFGLTVEGATPIVDAVLFYGLVGEPIVRRIYPELMPGQPASLAYTERLERGQFAPGTELRFWWELEAADGSRLVTAEQVMSYEHDEHDWQRMSDGQIEMLWYGDATDRRQAEQLLAQAEQTIARLKADFGVTIPQTIDVYVYNTQRDMLPALSSRSDVYDASVLTLGVALDDDTLLVLGSHRDAEITVAHELSHIVVGIATDNAFVQVPRWLDEGLAMHAQPELPSDNRAALERAIRDDQLLSVRSMTSYPGRAEQVDLFYGEVFGLIEFMQEAYGRDKIQALLEAFAEGQPQEQALQTALGFGLDELDARWRESLGLEPRARSEAAEAEPLASATAELAAPLGESPAPEAAADEQRERDRVCPITLGLLLVPLGVLGWRGRVSLFGS